jgi:hypothetical protein
MMSIQTTGTQVRCRIGHELMGSLPRLFCGLLVAASLLHVSLAAEDSPTQETQRRISLLITQLGSNEYVTRHHAERELISLGFEAFDAIMAARDSSDAEVAARASYLAATIDISWALDGDSIEVRQILQNYGSRTSWGDERESKP